MMPITAMGRRLDRVRTEQHRQQRTRRHRHDLAMASDDEMDELGQLACTAEACTAMGQPVVWTVEEQAVLERLGATHAAHRRW
jgi:hypothetical protein